MRISDEDLRRLDIRAWTSTKHDCLPIEQVHTYEPCRIAGVVRRLRVDPRNGTIEATVDDGWSWLRTRWDIAGPLPRPKVVPGCGLILEGIARLDADGELVMLDPNLRVVPGPEAGDIAETPLP